MPAALPNSPLASGAPTGAPPPMGAMRPPSHVGPVTVASANPGNQAAAHAAIKNAAEGLQQALLQLPMGSEEHTKILGIVKTLSSMTADSAPDPHAQMQGLVQQARQAAQGGPPAGLSGVMPAMPTGSPAGPAPDAAMAAERRSQSWVKTKVAFPLRM